MLAEAERLKDALKLFDQTITRWPQIGEAYIGRARTETGLNQSQAAIKDYERGLQLAAAPDKKVDPQPEWYLELYWSHCPDLPASHARNRVAALPHVRFPSLTSEGQG